ncbi:MAG: DUF4135 domain-containing protein [Vicingaceae bacterium]|nr:DUF4135 domain-containing protein [Vicingaceae bacterium]
MYIDNKLNEKGKIQKSNPNNYSINYLLEEDTFKKVSKNINFDEFNKILKKEKTPLNHSFLIIDSYVNSLIVQVLNQQKFIELECSNNNISYELTNVFTGEFRKVFISAITYEYEVYYKAFKHENNIKSQMLFVAEITNNLEWLIYFFESYPELKRITSKLIENHIVTITDIILKYRLDKTLIFNKFNIPENSKINSITTNLGDFHNNGKTTCRIYFNSSTAIYLKYRSLKTDIFFNEFINFLESKGLKKTIYQTEIIDCKSYGWQKEVTPKETSNVDRIKNFYFNQGINLSIAYILNIEDLIADNIIAYGELATFFDLEMMLTPRFKRKKDYLNNSKAAKIFHQSVIKTGLVPILGFETFNPSCS